MFRLPPRTIAATVTRSSAPVTTPHLIKTQISIRALAARRIAASRTVAIRRSPSVARRADLEESAPDSPSDGNGSTTPDSSSKCCPGGTPMPHHAHFRVLLSTVLRQRGHSILGLLYCRCSCCFFSRNLRAYSPSDIGADCGL